MSHASCFFVEVSVNCCVNFLIDSGKFSLTFEREIRQKQLMMHIIECVDLTY